jgi:hypothetical protein
VGSGIGCPHHRNPELTDDRLRGVDRAAFQENLDRSGHRFDLTKQVRGRFEREDVDLFVRREGESVRRGNWRGRVLNRLGNRPGAAKYMKK